MVRKTNLDFFVGPKIQCKTIFGDQCKVYYAYFCTHKFVVVSLYVVVVVTVVVVVFCI